MSCWSCKETLGWRVTSRDDRRSPVLSKELRRPHRQMVEVTQLHHRWCSHVRQAKADFAETRSYRMPATKPVMVIKAFPEDMSVYHAGTVGRIVPPKVTSTSYSKRPIKAHQRQHFREGDR